MEVQGKLFHFNKGAAFFSFHHDGGEHVCLFRPNKIIIDKQKLGASNFKSVEAIAKVGIQHPAHFSLLLTSPKVGQSPTFSSFLTPLLTMTLLLTDFSCPDSDFDKEF